MHLPEAEKQSSVFDDFKGEFNTNCIGDANAEDEFPRQLSRKQKHKKGKTTLIRTAKVDLNCEYSMKKRTTLQSLFKQISQK